MLQYNAFVVLLTSVKQAIGQKNLKLCMKIPVFNPLIRKTCLAHLAVAHNYAHGKENQVEGIPRWSWRRLVEV